MKRIGLFPLFFFLFIWIFFPFYPLQVLSLFVLLLYGVAFLLSRITSRLLVVERDKEIVYCPNRSHEEVRFTIRNRGFLPVENIVVLDQANGCYGEGTGLFLTALPRRSEKTYSCSVLTGTRGKYTIGPLRLKGSDPFYFFPWEVTKEVYSHLVVYPAFHPLELLLKEGDRGGSIKSDNLLYEDLSDLKGIREYRQGDSLKRINWKATARTGALQTMEYSRNLSAPVLVLLDLNRSRYPLKHRHILMERAIEAAASIIVSFGRQGQKVSLLTTGGDRELMIPPRSGYGHIISILEDLAQIELGSTETSYTVIRSLYEKGLKRASGSHIYLLVPEFGEEMVGELEGLYREKSYLHLVATGGSAFTAVPSFCRSYTLTDYGKDYFYD